MDGGPSRRRTAEATRSKLLVAGQVAFAAKGHDGVNLQRDVLTPAGVSVGSFYHQFRDKTDLLVAILDEGAELGRATMTQAGTATTDPVAATRATFEALFGLADAGEDIVRIHMRERDNPDPRVRALLARTRVAWVDAWERSFQRYVGEDSCFDPRQAAQIVVATGLGTLVLYLDAAPEERPALKEGMLDALTRYTVGGFLALGATDPRR